MSILYINGKGQFRCLNTASSGLIAKSGQDLLVVQSSNVSSISYVNSFTGDQNMLVDIEPGEYLIDYNFCAINNDITFLDGLNWKDMLEKPYYVELSTDSGLSIDKTILLDGNNPLIKYFVQKHVIIDKQTTLAIHTNYNNLSNIAVDIILIRLA